MGCSFSICRRCFRFNSSKILTKSYTSGKRKYIDCSGLDILLGYPNQSDNETAHVC